MAMSIPSFNVINPEAVEAYLAPFANGDERIGFLLTSSLRKVLLRRAENIAEVTTIPADAPEWLHAKWETGKPWHRFETRKDPRLAGKILYIAQWLEKVIAVSPEWLSRTDEKGRPRKLMQLKTIDQFMEEANRNIIEMKKSDCMFDKEGDIQDIMTFADGFKIVRMRTPGALDREGCWLKHCIGDGQYDAQIASNEWRFYSLRDKKNKPLATFKVYYPDRSISDLSATSNNLIPAACSPYIFAFCKQFNLNFAGAGGEKKYTVQAADEFDTTA